MFPSKMTHLYADRLPILELELTNTLLTCTFPVLSSQGSVKVDSELLVSSSSNATVQSVNQTLFRGNGTNKQGFIFIQILVKGKIDFCAGYKCDKTHSTNMESENTFRRTKEKRFLFSRSFLQPFTCQLEVFGFVAGWSKIVSPLFI